MSIEVAAVLSLVFLVVAIALGFAKGMNTGVVSMAFALIACIVCGLTDKQLRSGFPTNMFLILFGTMFLFNIAQKTGTMSLLSRKVIAAVGNASFLLPWAIYALTWVISACGAGPAPSIAIVALPAISLALELGVSPFLFAIMCEIGGCCGAAFPLATAGIVAEGLIEDFGWPAIQPAFTLNALIGHTLVALIVYIIFKGYKIRPTKKLDKSDIPAFSKQQCICLIGIVAFMVLAFVTGYNVGLCALIVGLILIALKVGPTDKEVIKDMSWNTILLICGVSILMNVVVLTGGIDLMVAGLSSLMTEKTAAPIMGLTAGIMSWFSTTTSVVMPTLIPTIPGILEKLGGDVNVMQMLSSVVNTSFAAAVSPLSAGGGIVLATYVQLTSCKEEEQSKWFKNLFLVAILCVVLMVIVDALGIYIHI